MFNCSGTIRGSTPFVAKRCLACVLSLCEQMSCFQIEFIVAFLAVVMCRCIAAPLNAKYKTEESAFYLDDSASKLFILPQESTRYALEAASAKAVPIVRLVVNVTPAGALTHTLSTAQGPIPRGYDVWRTA